MEYTAGVTKAEFKPKTEYKVKAETRKFIKPSYIITALGIGFCAAFTIYGMQKGLFTSQEAMEQFLKPFGIWGASDFYSDSDSSGGDSHHTGRSFLSGRCASVRAAVGIYL